jgi:hypothetical protein
MDTFSRSGMQIYRKYLLCWPIYKRITWWFFSSTNICRGSTLKKVEFQSSVQSDHSARPEKTFKCALILPQHQNIAIFLHILDISLGRVIGLSWFLFLLSQASWDTSLDYAQHIIPRTVKFLGLTRPPLADPTNIVWRNSKKGYLTVWASCHLHSGCAHLSLNRHAAISFFSKL